MSEKKPLIIEPVALPEDGLPKPIDFATIFGNNRPTELEIGSGKGTFLVHEATARPDVNFLGIEWARFYWRYASDRLRRLGLVDNVRMMRADADVFVKDHLPDDSLAAVHIYFPDPWPKARHHKRRLIQKPFMLEMRRVLQPGGILRIKTDHADYAQHMRDIFVDPPLTPIDFEGDEVGTNFEKKYIAEGRSFHRFAFRRDG